MRDLTDKTMLELPKKDIFLGIPEGPGNAEITDKEIPGPGIILNPSVQTALDFYTELSFQAVLSHSDSSTSIWESLWLTVPSGVLG